MKKTNVEKKKPDNSMEEMPGNENAINPLMSQDDSLNTYYDKRLINICQVPQMPYLIQDNNGLWTLTQEAIKAVMNGTLYIKKEGQAYYMVDLNEQSHRRDYKEHEEEIASENNPANTVHRSDEQFPKLKTYHTLTKEDVEGLEIISDDDFSDIVDSIILNDYRNIPNAIRLPNLKAELAEKLGLGKDAAFILKKNATHIRPDRKGGYGQAFDTEEYRRIPEVLRNADFAIVDNVFQNFQIVFDDENDGSKINKLVFNKDELGNYLVTIGKVDRENAFAEERNIVVAVGVAPTIQTLRTSASSTALRASTTTNNQNLSQEKPHVKSVGELLAELDSKAWNEHGIESVSDFTGHPEKIKSYASSIKDYLDANGIKELDRETFSFLEATNYHTLNNILGLHGVYGEEFRRRAIERADSPYSNYDRNTALEIVNGIDHVLKLQKIIQNIHLMIGINSVRFSNSSLQK